MNLNFLVGNRNFNSFEDAFNYCMQCDFSPELIQVKEEI